SPRFASRALLSKEPPPAGPEPAVIVPGPLRSVSEPTHACTERTRPAAPTRIAKALRMALLNLEDDPVGVVVRRIGLVLPAALVADERHVVARDGAAPELVVAVVAERQHVDAVAVAAVELAVGVEDDEG